MFSVCPGATEFRHGFQIREGNNRFGWTRFFKFDPAYWRKVSSEQKFPEEYWEALAESGLFGMIIEKKFGGMGRSILDLTLAVEETAEHFAGLGSYLYLSGSLVSQMFEVCGSEEQKKSFLPEIAKGRL